MSATQKRPQLVIITGMSGAGKTIAIQSLEDIGFFCIDNLPPVLIAKFAELIVQSQGRIGKVALVIDLRGREFFTALSQALHDLHHQFVLTYDIVYLDATDAKLVQRYKESRRRHPLSPQGAPLEGIAQERTLLQDLKERATIVIDTTNIKPFELKERIIAQFQDAGISTMCVNIVSFGYKYGVPIDADLLFDVRFLPNPHYVDALRPYPGTHHDVYDYVMQWGETQEFLDKLLSMLHFLLPQYRQEGKSQLVIGIGCTGGKHRSVAIAAHIGKLFLGSETEAVHVRHRDIERDK
jgi:UPF0042 nucleotide-binding protein